MRAVRKALLAVDETKRARSRQLLAIVLTAALFLCAGFAIGRYTAFFTLPASGVKFKEPLIESAVRAQRKKTNGEAITQDDLKAVRALYVFGENVADSAEAFAGGFANHERGIRGGIASLEDLAMMPNLEEIKLEYQSLEELSGIEGLNNLSSVSFMHTRIDDIALLAGLKNLALVNLFDTNVSDALALNACPRLEGLDLGLTLIASPEKIGGYDTVERLALTNTRLDTLKGIEKFKKLKELRLSDAEVPDWEALQYAPSLQTLYVDAEAVATVSARLEGSGLTIGTE